MTSKDLQQGLAKKANQVMLNRKNICRRRPMEKLDYPMFGPLVVKRNVHSRAYELELPARWTLHPVFHVSLLKPYWLDPIGSPAKEIPVPEIVEEQSSYIVAEVVGSWWYENAKSKLSNHFVQFFLLQKSIDHKKTLRNHMRH